jgi:hypothetical protein
MLRPIKSSNAEIVPIRPVLKQKVSHRVDEETMAGER